MPNVIIAGIIIAIGLGTLLVLGLETMALIMTLGGLVWMVAGIVERVREGPKMDEGGRFHDSNTGQFISKETAFRSWTGIAAAIVLPVMIKADTIVQIMPFIVVGDPFAQVGAAFVTNLIGWILS